MATPNKEHSAGNGKSILLVDDEPIVIKLMLELLKESGFKLLTAKDGEEALEIFSSNRHKIDLVISDLLMDGMKGDKLFLKLKKLRGDIRFLLCTASHEGFDQRPFLEIGMKGVIIKPFEIDRFVRIVANALPPSETIPEEPVDPEKPCLPDYSLQSDTQN